MGCGIVTNNITDYGTILPEMAESNITETRKDMGDVYDYLNDFLGDVDPRIKEYYQSTYDNLNNQMNELNDSDIIIRDSHRRFQNTYDDYTRAKQAASQINANTNNAVFDIGAATVNAAKFAADTVIKTINSIINPDKKVLKINQADWNSQSPKEQENIKKRLKELGLTDQEITDIINGNVVVDRLTFDQMKAELTDAIKHNPATIVKLEQVLGFSILDENNEVDDNKLALAMHVAGKNLGMDIDMTEGSPFRKEIASLSIDLQAEYRKDPTIRTKIASIYGVDIFDINGKVDQEKLAVIKMIDGINKKDGFDITQLLSKNTISQAQKTSPSPIVDPNPTTDPITVGPTSTPPTTTPADPSKIVTPLVEDTEKNKNDVISASVKDGFGNVGGGILDAIEKGASRIARGVSPYSGNVGATKGMNKATAGIIAAASVAAGGVAAGGGVLVSKKLNMIHFTPADWSSLGADYQSIIEALMRKVGFSTDDVETFKTSNFKIPSSELKEHIKKIEKALDSNPTCDDELLKLYNFSMIDDQNKVIDYLLFITMVIDGRNSIDEYNMYNIINQSVDNADEADFIYNGIDMEDYIDDTAEENVTILNDPTVSQSEEKEIDDTEIVENDDSTNDTKEWLKGIGIDD